MLTANYRYHKLSEADLFYLLMSKTSAVTGFNSIKYINAIIVFYLSHRIVYNGNLFMANSQIFILCCNVTETDKPNTECKSALYFHT